LAAIGDSRKILDQFGSVGFDIPGYLISCADLLNSLRNKTHRDISMYL